MPLCWGQSSWPEAISPPRFSMIRLSFGLLLVWCDNHLEVKWIIRLRHPRLSTAQSRSDNHFSRRRSTPVRCFAETSPSLPRRVRLQVQPPPHADGSVPNDPPDRLTGPDRHIQEVVCFGVKCISITRITHKTTEYTVRLGRNQRCGVQCSGFSDSIVPVLVVVPG